MAGDASLGITPVMKWNFERSCYRWLVTRHPAQFERLDFTAQILQSASRARKAFYECGWAEAKVLIRPSDGKFERTPFFDAIIRRGLRNSTRFDASTLTEDEIEALGMHRDETLGFKLQIRHFRSNRKELPPQGRGGGGVRKQQQQQQPTQQPQNHRLPGAAAMVAGRSLPSSHSGGVSTRAPVASGVDQQQQQWGTEAAAVAAVAAATAARSNGDPRWADEARWHRAGAHGGGGGGGGGGDRWTAWDANRWMPGSEGASPTVVERDHRYGSGTTAGHLTATPLGRGLTHASPPSAVSPGVAAPARHGAWEGAPPSGGVWGGQDRRPVGSSSWHLSTSGADGRGEAFDRSVRSDGESVGREGFGGGGGGVRPPPPQQQQQQAEADLRGGGGGGGGFHFHPSVAAEQQQGQHPGPASRTSPGPVGAPGNTGGGFRHGAVGIDAPARDGSPDSSSAGAAGNSLISQGYRRLAAMADERAAAAAAVAAAGGGSGAIGLPGRRVGGAPTAAAVLDYHARHHSPVRQPLPHQFDGVAPPPPPLAGPAAAAADHKRTAASMTGSCNGNGGGGVEKNVGGAPPARGGEAAGFEHGGRFAQQRPPARSLPTPSIGEDGDGSPAKKKPRPSLDGGERPVGVNGVGSTHQGDGPLTLPRSSSNERLMQNAWQRDVRGLSTPPPLSGVQGEQLARELAESERQLLSSRVALDLAQARYEEASRTHHAKRDEVIAAAAAQQNQRAIAEATAAKTAPHVQHQHQHQRQDTQEECSSLHSLARSCEAAAASSETEASPSGSNDDYRGAGDASGAISSGSEDGSGGGAGGDDAVSHHRHRLSPSPTHGRSHAVSNRGGGGRSSEAGGRPVSASSSPEMMAAVPSPRRKLSGGSSNAALGPDCADEMREVKLEAALLCGIGRAPVPRRSAVSSSSASPSSPPVTASGGAGAADSNTSTTAASMAQVPGSPSASGDTDSDHSSLGGGGSGGGGNGGGGGGESVGASSKHRHHQHQHQQRHHQHQRPALMGGGRGSSYDEPPRSGSAERDAAWGGYARGGSVGMGGGGDGRRAGPRAGDVLV